MTAKPTQERWEPDNIAPDLVVPSGGVGGIVAQVCGDGIHQLIARVQLIASAPDLLEACRTAERALVADAQAEQAEGRTGTASRAMNILSAAIAKATRQVQP